MTSTLRPLIAVALAMAALPVLAQFKVVGPDGRITYTDRPPPAEAGKASLLNRSTGAPAGDSSTQLPVDLRQVAQRYPVTLYSTADCSPCDSGRRMLTERGIPFSERRLVSEDDADALQRLTGARTVPSLTIGTQALRGFSEADWQIYLDDAGYPRESRLPRNYVAPPATPLVERTVPARGQAAAPARAAEPAAASAPDAPPANPGSIRF